MAKKKNPSVSLKKSDVERMKKEITKDAVSNAFVLLFTVMHDKWGFGHKRLARLMKQINELSEMVTETPHCVTFEQLKNNLKDELNIEIT